MAAPRQQGAAASNSSMILDGRYSTGANTPLRRTRDADLFRRFPQLRELVMEHPSSATFYESRILSYGDRLEDGFVARFAEELLLIDSRTDLALQHFVGVVQDQIEGQNSATDKVALASRLIAEAFGGHDAESRWPHRLGALRVEPPDVLPIGSLLGIAGLCRHRALLLKYMLDKFGICRSAVLDGVVVADGEVNIASLRARGISVDHMWNIVKLDEPLLCDLMQVPGKLCSFDELQRLSVRYHRPGGRAGFTSLDDVERAMSRGRGSLAEKTAAVESEEDEKKETEQEEQEGQAVPDVGSAVEIFSNTFDHWLPGRVIDHLQDGSITVEFSVDAMRLRKHIDICSPHLRMSDNYYEAVPCCTLRDSSEAYSLLAERIRVRFGQQDWETLGELRLLHHQNNSFYCASMMQRECEICYTGPAEDILVKVYAVSASRHKYNEWDQYAMCGYIHAMQSASIVRIDERGPYFLGFVVYRGINVEWFWTLTEADIERNLRRSTPGGWQGRGEVEAKTKADEADYILSGATQETEANNQRVQRLTQRPVHGPHGHRPISFCTDRSLGMGQHFQTIAAKTTLYLGKHGFGMPISTGVWFEDYVKATNRTAHGMLVLSYSSEYFSSAACRLEIHGLRYDQVHMYAEDLDRILTFDEYQEHLRGIAPLVCQASLAGNAAEVSAILQKRPAAVRDHDSNRSTPLILAADYGHASVGKVLLSVGAAVDAQDLLGKTALLVSAMGGHDEVAALLLRHRAALHAVDSTGCQAIHKAAAYGSLPMMKLLLEARAASNSRATSSCANNRKESTPLHLAAQWGFKETVQLLFAHGADRLGQDDDGKTALEYAVRGRDEIGWSGCDGMVEICQSWLEQSPKSPLTKHRRRG